jgi:putative spermidine/putrescine transport system ATP-binding protein
MSGAPLPAGASIGPASARGAESGAPSKTFLAPDSVTPHLEISGITKRFDNFVAVDNVSFSMRKGERLALLGPSGCGKTTLLNIIAGFIDETAGSVRVAGRDISSSPPHKRNIGVVFQNYALFPHLTVGDNIGFGLKFRKLPRRDIEAAIARALEIVRLGPYRDRYPHQLSGGQQQRTAIARAIVIKPEILLLDEPLSNLDAKLREDMRTDLLAILDDLAITTILVTHDQAEALSLAHRVAVISTGRIEQIGSPIEVYENPATGFVAGFVGQSNRFNGRVKSHGAAGAEIEIAGGRLLSLRPRISAADGDEVLVFIRAERLHVGRDPVAADNNLPGRLKHVIYLGSEQRLVVETTIGALTVTQPVAAGQRPFVEGETLHCGCGADDVIVIRPQ